MRGAASAPRSRRTLALRTALVGLLVASVVTTCHTPLPRTAAPSVSQPAPWTLPTRVRVLLAGQEGAERLLVRRGQQQVAYWREGSGVASDREPFASPSQHWSPIGPFAIDGRTYLGELEIEPHPDGGLRAFVHVDLEVYVEGVVAAELPLWSSLPAELQAQAIAVRTYTVGALRRHPDREPFLWDGVQDQAFHGLYQPGENAGEQRAAVRLSRAIEATRGLVLMQNGELYDARYHAACGGTTVDRSAIFSGTAPSPPVACEPCGQRAAQEAAEGVPPRRPLTWEAQFSAPELNALARELRLGQRLVLIEPMQADRSGRWQQVRVQGDQRAVAMSLHALRRALGFGAWKSGQIVAVEASGTRLPADRTRGIGPRGITVRGLGRGHGVGLCQEGLHDYASMGWSDRAILRHYYPGTEVVRLPVGH